MARKKVDLQVVQPSDIGKRGKKKRRPGKDPLYPPGGRPLWSGSISFGLVNVPVRMVPGVSTKRYPVSLLHEKDNAVLKRKYVCAVEDKEVPADEIKKGYEITPERQCDHGGRGTQGAGAESQSHD
jgi:hypothetical protein